MTSKCLEMFSSFFFFFYSQGVRPFSLSLRSFSFRKVAQQLLVSEDAQIAAEVMKKLEAEKEVWEFIAKLKVREIEILTEEREKGWEGCLSVPGLRGAVPRYTALRYKGTTPSGETIERVARGFHARVVQHECDHLDGVLYPQRMDDLTELIFETEARAWLAAREPAEEPEEEKADV